MAKTFNQVYKVAKETTYGGLGGALVLAASLNSVVKFSPVLKSNGTAGAPDSSAEYIIQRGKRIKSKIVAKPNTGTTAVALAALDSFSQVD